VVSSVWAYSLPLAWESSAYCCSSASWAGSSAGPGEGTPRQWAWGVCLSPEWDRAPVTDPDMVADMVLPAAVSSRACSEDLAELSLAIGFTISSQVATVVWDRAMPQHIHRQNPPRRQTRAATNSLAVMTMAAREPRGTTQAALILEVVVTGAVAMVAVTGVAAAAVTGVVVVETAEVGDLVSPDAERCATGARQVPVAFSSVPSRTT